MQVLEDQHQRAAPRTRPEELLEGVPDLVAHQDRIAARRGEREVALVGEAHREQLAEEVADPAQLGRRDQLGEALVELVAQGRQADALDHPERGAHRLRDDAERRAGAHRIAAPDPDPLELAALGEAGDQLVAQARLADADVAGDEHDPRHRLDLDLGEDRLEHQELAVAADERRRTAHQGADRHLRAPLAPQLDHRAALGDLEAGVEQARRHLIEEDRDRAGGVGLDVLGEQPRRVIDDLADRQPPGDDRGAGRQHDRVVLDALANRERAARRVGRQVRRRALAAQDHHDVALGELLDVRAVAGGRRQHPRQGVGRVGGGAGARGGERDAVSDGVGAVEGGTDDDDADQPLLRRARRELAGPLRPVRRRRDGQDGERLGDHVGGRARRRVLREQPGDQLR